MLTLTQKEIKIPENCPNLIIIVGPCRVGTTALANIFSKIGLTVYMQPIKSARRAKEAGEEIIPWQIAEADVAVSKETLGPKTRAEFFNPVEILLNLGYPKEKLVLIPIVRDPRKTLASWREMWDDLDLLKFVQSYELILEIKNQSQMLGIKTIPYIHEVIRDCPPRDVLQKLFQKVGLEKNVSENVINWKDAPKFGEEKSEDSRLKFYDVPPDRFIKEVKNWGIYQYKEEVDLRLAPNDVIFLKQNIAAENIYEEFRRGCEGSLSLKIKPFNEINYWY